MSSRVASVIRIAAAAGLFAFAAAGWMGYVAARHNPQGEFNGPDGELSIARLLPVIVPWFVAAFLLTAAVLWVGWRILREPR